VWNGTSTDLRTVFADESISSSSWVVISSRIDGSNQEGVEHDDIIPVSAQFVKLAVNDTTCADSNARVAEFEVYGTTAPISAFNPALQVSSMADSCCIIC
jgi:hypothetical protein